MTEKWGAEKCCCAAPLLVIKASILSFIFLPLIFLSFPELRVAALETLDLARYARSGLRKAIMLDIQTIQKALRSAELDGWLLYDFRGTNSLARRILQLDDRSVTSRRFFYYVPADGAPQKLVHRIEVSVLDHLPGTASVYLTWQQLESGVAKLIEGANRVAMEYSPGARNPYVSRVDAGTIELVSSFGTRVVSSGDLIQQFEATWDDQQWKMHLEAARHTNQAFARAWALICDHVGTGRELRETEVQSAILEHFKENGLTTDHPPIVAVGEHSGNPHFEPSSSNDLPIKEDDFVLIDLWAKLARPRGVYSDLTRVAYVGAEVPERFAQVFEVVAGARDAAIETVREAFANGRALAGWEVDRAARTVIEEAGYGEYFIHRTGHSIGLETHGNGANMDDLEMHDERRVLPATCFSIEPGIYLPEFGIRSEVNLYVDSGGTVHVTGGELQTAVRPLIAKTG
jgi:Xaa-Pro dipeptidase